MKLSFKEPRGKTRFIGAGSAQYGVAWEVPALLGDHMRVDREVDYRTRAEPDHMIAALKKMSE